MRRRLLLLPALAALALSGGAAAQAVPPPLTTVAPAAEPVRDDAHLLTADEAAALSRRLRDIEASTGRQIVVVTTSGLDGRDIAEVATDLGNRLRIGGACCFAGVLLLVAPREHLVRLAVGQGLQDVIADAAAQDIINDVILPEFREGHMAAGIQRGADAIAARLGESK